MLYFKFIPIAFVITNLSNLITWRSKFKPLNFLIMKLGCLYCSSFWITLFVTKDIFIASATALIAYIIDKWIL
jgi:hypothetical protein